jgi:hypothetical protein
MKRLVFLTLLSGCGFMGEPPFDGVRLPDVAPWQDVGPLTICDGTTRLGPGDEDAVGFCAAQAGASCAADKDCRSRERCVCGKCSVAACDTADECGPDLTCSFAERRCDRACDVDADCARGETCVPGMHVCRGPCGTSDDCQTGETCQTSTGLCVASACADSSTCFGGRQCLLQRKPAALAEPSPLVENGQVILYFERTDPAGSPEIWRATSTDGMQFTIDPPRALLAGRAPSVVHTTAWFMLYAEPGGLALATSPDGSAWTTSQHAMNGGDQPSLIALQPGGDLVAYFAAPDGTVARQTIVGSAFGAAETVLAPAQLSDPVLWRGVDRIASPFAQQLTDANGRPFVRLWFAGHGTEVANALEFGKQVPTPPDFAVGEAASTDGRSFVPYPFNPVFTRVLDFLTHPSELDPAIATLDDTHQLLYYRRAAADGTQSENLAAARTPRPLE